MAGTGENIVDPDRMDYHTTVGDGYTIENVSRIDDITDPAQDSDFGISEDESVITKSGSIFNTVDFSKSTTSNSNPPRKRGQKRTSSPTDELTSKKIANIDLNIKNIKTLIEKSGIPKDTIKEIFSTLDTIASDVADVIKNLESTIESKISNSYQTAEFATEVQKYVNQAMNKPKLLAKRTTAKKSTPFTFGANEINQNLRLDYPHLTKEDRQLITYDNIQHEDSNNVTANNKKNITKKFAYTFADATNLAVPNHTPNNLYKVIVRVATKLDKNAEGTEITVPVTAEPPAKILNRIDPTKYKLKFKYRTVNRDGSVAIQFNSKIDLDRFTEIVNNEEFRPLLDIQYLQPLQPSVIIAGIERDTSEETIQECIKEIIGEYPTHVYLFPFKQGRDTTSASVQTPPWVWRRLMTLKTIQIKWAVCKIYDQVRVRRCGNCLQYGHSNTKLNPCKRPTANKDSQICPACSDYNKKLVDSKSMELRRDYQHAFNNLNCPSYIKAKESTILKTDYKSYNEYQC